MVRPPSRKKNILSLMTGPPNPPPYWLRWKGALNPVGAGSEDENELSRNCPKASPWKLFVPDFVVTFTEPEEVNSVDISILDWLIWNSWMALAGMSVVVVPTVSSDTSTPSTSMRAVLPKRHPKEIAY